MQDGHKETDENNNIRKDYTNLQFVYGLKLFMFVVIALSAILQTRNDFHSLAVNACTYSIGIVFDFFVVIFSNNGPKTKNIKLVKIATSVPIIALGLGLIILFSSYNPNNELIKLILSWLIRFLILSESILGPYTELSLNRPNDD